MVTALLKNMKVSIEPLHITGIPSQFNSLTQEGNILYIERQHAINKKAVAKTITSGCLERQFN